MSVQTWTWILVGVTFALYFGIAIWARAGSTKEFYVAGGGVSPLANGMATAADWMSAASFISMAGLISFMGYDGSVFLMGWTGGYVLLLVLMAGQVRRFGKYTASDFIGDRFYSKGLRGTGAGLTIFISLSYCVGQFAGIGLMFKWILGIDFTLAVIIGSSVVLIYTLISGMLGVTKNMQIQYVIIIVSFLIPLFIMAIKYGYMYLLPHIGYGQLLTDITNGLKPLLDSANAFGHSIGIMPSAEFVMPWDPATGASSFQWIAICFSLMLGTAGLPHVIQRFYVVPKARDARWSVVWGLFFICLLYWSAPIYSAFGKLFSSNPAVGKLAKDAIVVYTAQLGDVVPIIVGLLAAGGISAAFSTVSGLLVAGGSAFSHDLYYKVINPQASEKKQMFMGRAGIIGMAVIVTLIALLKLALIAQLVALAFSLAAVTIFPMFLLGIWWSGSTRAGAWAGLITGGGIALIALIYFVVGKLGGTLPGHGFINYYLNAWYFAWIGAPLAIAANIIASKFSKEKTPEDIKKLLAEKVHNL